MQRNGDMNIDEILADIFNKGKNEIETVESEVGGELPDWLSKLEPDMNGVGEIHPEELPNIEDLSTHIQRMYEDEILRKQEEEGPNTPDEPNYDGFGSVDDEVFIEF